MTYYGLAIGAATFLTIGAFHPLVIKAEYYWGAGSWWIFLVVGLGCATASLFVCSIIASVLLGVVGFSCLWSVHELFMQQRRVDKGWFPAGPGHKKATPKASDSKKKGH